MESIILIKHNKNWGLDEDLVRKMAGKGLEYFGYNKKPYELSVIFVGRKKAKQLNQDYRKRDYIPQVLGFPMSKTEKDCDGIIRLGDIVICTEKLKYEVGFQKKGLEEVLEEWMIHGVENLIK
jgi:rRNA maturation RNase YbeY